MAATNTKAAPTMGAPEMFISISTSCIRGILREATAEGEEEATHIVPLTASPHSANHMQ